MKNLRFLLVLLLGVLFAIRLFAGTTVSNLITFASINNTTNNGSPVLIGTAYISTTPTFNIQQEGLFSTNDIIVRIQYGLDTNTFTTVATSYAPNTNATDWQIAPSGITLSIYARTAITTTNNTDVGSKAVFVTP